MGNISVTDKIYLQNLYGGRERNTQSEICKKWGLKLVQNTTNGIYQNTTNGISMFDTQN